MKPTGFDNSVLEKLDFDTVRLAVARHCHSRLGKNLAESLKPSVKPNIIKTWHDQVREVLPLVDTHGLPPMGGVFDVRDSVKASAFPAPLEPGDLSTIADTLFATHAVSLWLEKALPAAPSLQTLQQQINDLSPIAVTIRESIDGRGHVVDEASPKLASIRSSIDAARARIRSAFERILRQTQLTKFLQYAGSTFHNDRMVLPLKAEHHGRIPGIVHRSSDTGATLFVEPSASVELNNTIIRLRDEEKKEIDQILRQLTQRIKANDRTILQTLRALGALDLVGAKCRYARQRTCTTPIVDDHGTLDLHEARHPVLLELYDDADNPENKRHVVPIDIRLGDDFDVLVVTGPNTGGKTVAIKTVGLMVVMNQCGLPVPCAEGARLPVYRKLFIDIGDEQSLQQSLSTFSSHLTTLLEVITSSGPHSLVLVDELGAGTDPDEGAAIGRAIVAELLDLKAKAIISTHLSALKAIAFTTDRVDNASVEFDVESLRPTYRLRIGEPGNSNALIIAKRLGMPSRLIQRAKGYLDDSSRALQKAIAGTLKSRRDAEQARRRAREAALESQRERQRLEDEAAAMRDRQQAFSRWTSWLHELQKGDTVYVRPLRKEGTVVRMALQQQRVLVQAGTMQLELPFSDIVQSEEDA